jgi:hypothetical protein
VSPTELKLFSNGRYALVDLYHRNVWINTYSEKIAHEVKQTFWSKASTVVFDLTCFKNYTEHLIDSEVALMWRISCADLLSPLTSISLANRELEKTQVSYTTELLINEPSSSLLEKHRQHDLQQQMLFYVFLLKKINWENTIISDGDIELFRSIRQIFQTELELECITKKIIKVSGVSISGPRCLATQILSVLNAQYE